MRFLRVVISALFIVVMAGSVFLLFETRTDTTIPTITSSETVIKGKCSITDKELLSYVTANDMKDGDLTERVFVENVSRFISEGESTVTFCVVDDDNNVAKKNVKLIYEDYKKPVLTLSGDLMFMTDSRINVAGVFGCTDSIDGDVTDKLTAVSDGDTDLSLARVPIEVKVTNSMGYTYEWDFEALRIDMPEKSGKYSSKLKRYYYELKVGSSAPNFSKNVDEFLKENEEYDNYTLKIDDSELNLEKAGMYNVFYGFYDAGELVELTRVIVSCEE